MSVPMDTLAGSAQPGVTGAAGGQVADTGTAAAAIGVCIVFACLLTLIGLGLGVDGGATAARSPTGLPAAGRSR